MKKTNLLTMMTLAAGVFVITSCGTQKTLVSQAVPSQIKVQPTLEGASVNVETTQLQGIEMADALNDDGTDMVKRPYKWYAGTSVANNKQVAIEMAQREAYATISRILNNAVKDQAERGNIANNGAVQQALKAHWEQFSVSLTKACEPFGSTTIKYEPSTGMYEATAKVAIRGDKFNQLIKTAGSFKPANLSGDDLQKFTDTNQAIMEAAK